MAVYTVSGGGDALKTQLNSAPDNSVILVEPGVYNPLNPGNTTKRVQVIGLDKATCIIDGGGTSECYQGRVMYGSTVSNIRLFNFTVRNGITSPDKGGNYRAALYGGQWINCDIHHLTGVQRYNYNGDGSVSTTHIMSCVTWRNRFYGCSIHDCTSNASWDWQPAGLTNCEFYNNTWRKLVASESEDGKDSNSEETFMVWGTSTNSIIHHNTSIGNQSLTNSALINCIVAFNTGVTHPVNGVVPHSLIYRPGNSNVNWWQSGSRLLNTVVYGNDGWNRVVSANGSNNVPKMANCALANNTPLLPVSNSNRIIWAYAQGSIHNCAFDTPKNQSYSQYADPAFDAAGNIFDVSDMGFVDPANMDFRLKPTSPLIALGSRKYNSQEATDLVGNPWKDTPAVGPYEFYEDGAKLGWKMPNYMQPFGGFSATGEPIVR